MLVCCGRAVTAVVGHERRAVAPRLLHLAQGRAPKRALVRIVARRPPGEEQAHVSRVVAHRGRQAAHRAERAIRQRRFLHPVIVLQPVAPGDSVLGDAVGVPGRRRHAERPKHALVGERARRLAGHVGDDAPEHPVAEVRVLERHPGRQGERHTPLHPAREFGVAGVEVAVGPGVVGHEPRGHGQQLAHGDRGGVERRIRNARQLGHVRLDLVVQRQAALVAKDQHAHRGEALRHRRDAEDRVEVGRRLAGDLADAHAAVVGEFTVDHHAVDDAGDPITFAEVGEDAVHLAEGGRERVAPGRVVEGRRRRDQRVVHLHRGRTAVRHRLPPWWPRPGRVQHMRRP